MTLAVPEPTAYAEFVDLVARLRANRMPPPAERRAIRQRANASLDDLAEVLGVGKMTLSRWERGERQPRPKHRVAYICLLQALAEVARENESSQPEK
jgi:DNA-binding transcriptional regulator YiaG